MSLIQNITDFIDAVGNDIKTLFRDKVNKNDVISINNGGTNATNVSDARSNLGLGTSATLNTNVANGVPTLDDNSKLNIKQIPDSGVISGNYGSAISIPNINVDRYGRIISASVNNIPISSSSNIGLVQLNNSINSTSVSTAATSNAVKSTYDYASTMIPLSQKGLVNGVATLDSTGKIPSNQLPSFVDDVLEYSNLANFPKTGESGKIYVALDTNKTYRWSGSSYVYITSGAVDSVAGKTGVVTLNKSDVGLENVDNTSDANKNVLSAKQLTSIRTITYNGDVTGSFSTNLSANVSTKLILSNTGVAAGTYRSVTVDSKGRVTQGTNPTTLSEYGITDVYTKTDIDNGYMTLRPSNIVMSDNISNSTSNVGPGLYFNRGLHSENQILAEWRSFFNTGIKKWGMKLNLSSNTDSTITTNNFGEVLEIYNDKIWTKAYGNLHDAFAKLNANKSLDITTHGNASASDYYTLKLNPGYRDTAYPTYNSVLSFNSTFYNFEDIGPRRTADIVAGFENKNMGVWGNEYLSFNVGDATDANNLTSPKLMLRTNNIHDMYGTLWLDNIVKRDGTYNQFMMANGGIRNVGNWNAIPSIRDDGCMEIGSCIDFHDSDTDNSDFKARLAYDKTNGELYSTNIFRADKGINSFGPINFANNTWNVVGDDVAFGDINESGTLGLQGQNGLTRLKFVNNSGNWGSFSLQETIPSSPTGSTDTKNIDFVHFRYETPISVPHLRIDDDGKNGGWTGFVINNRQGTKVNSSSYLDFLIHNVMKAGIRTSEQADGSADFAIMITPPGDTNVRRDKHGMYITNTFVDTAAYGRLHNYFARLDNIYQNIRANNIAVSSLKSGATSPNIAFKKLTSTFNVDSYGNIAIPHNLNQDRILDVSIKIFSKTKTSIINSGWNRDDNYGFSYYVDPSNIVISKQSNNSSQLIGQPITILITYEV